MKIKILFMTGLVAVGAAIAVVVSLDRSNSSGIVSATNPAPPSKAPAPPQPLPRENSVTNNAPQIVNATTPADIAPKPAVQAETTQDNTLTINGYAVQDPLARAALSYVGTDPDANAYWTDAINDPSLPPEERKDLIEDLNEDGFSDPHHPGPQDGPLILARIQLIETLAPNAMDQVDANAFAEAEKDLLGMLNGQVPQ